MKRLRVLVLLSVPLLLASSAEAITLKHNDLVGLTASGIVHIDGQTGARELITSVGGGDIAVAYGGGAIYTLGSGEPLEIDPVTGDNRVAASDFGDGGGRELVVRAAV